ncbi:MAG TPA: DUF302 domain-containing protein [Puia sp.]|nr:DUF302 domain-containing protein [Puia sp.]
MKSKNEINLPKNSDCFEIHLKRTDPGKKGRRKFLQLMIAPFLLPAILSFKKKSDMDPKGVITRPSNYSVKETIDKIQQFLEKQGVTIYARIDQQKEAARAGINLAALEFILFGNPKVGGALMAENPKSALDLPLKIIAWEDNDKKVWVSYNEASYIGDRYTLNPAKTATINIDPLIQKILAQ